MFVQVIQGHVANPAEVRRLLDRWVAELSKDAQGWLGSTAGVSDDGEFVALVRFTDAEAAQRNSNRREQDAWWREFEKVFEGPPVFHDCRRVETMFDGGLDDAGFVQVIQSEVADRDALEDLMGEMSGMDRETMGRTDVIGGVMAWHDDGNGLTQCVYFTSEDEARVGESTGMTDEARESMDAWNAAAGGIRYIDLRDPWMASPS